MKTEAVYKERTGGGNASSRGQCRQWRRLETSFHYVNYFVSKAAKLFGPTYLIKRTGFSFDLGLS